MLTNQSRAVLTNLLNSDLQRGFDYVGEGLDWAVTPPKSSPHIFLFFGCELNISHLSV